MLIEVPRPNVLAYRRAIGSRRLTANPLSTIGCSGGGCWPPTTRSISSSSDKVYFAKSRVHLQGQANRVGLLCREIPAEPGVALLTHVVYASPAAGVDLAATDRIDAVDGQGFSSLEQFYALLDKAHQSVTLSTERRGQVREVTIPLDSP